MKPDFFCQLLATAIVAFWSAWSAHFFAAKRDRKNKRHDQRIAFLVEAYRRLESNSNRHSDNSYREIESAIADIQLFGSPTQVGLAQAFANSFKDITKNPPLTEMLKALRKDFREELNLERVPDELAILRFEAFLPPVPKSIAAKPAEDKP